jgi:uncharacterized lipoprotein YddW (UPF0748 family)
MLEVATRYDVAGVQGDDRLPALPFDGGYNRETVAAYTKATGDKPPAAREDSLGTVQDKSSPRYGAKQFSPDWERWQQWRADQLTDFMSRLYRDLKKAKPDIIVSMAPTYFPWAIEDWLQDWPQWLRLGIIDHLAPQLYQKQADKYESAIKALVGRHVPANKRHLVSPGVLTKLSDGYQVSQTTLDEMIAINRKHCLNSEIYFFHESVVQGKK